MTSDEFLALLHHGREFRLIDQVEGCVPGQSAAALLRADPDRLIGFTGHFPPPHGFYLPGVVSVAALLELAWIQARAFYPGKHWRLAELVRARFTAPIRGKKRLHLTSSVESLPDRAFVAKGEIILPDGTSACTTSWRLESCAADDPMCLGLSGAAAQTGYVLLDAEPNSIEQTWYGSYRPIGTESFRMAELEHHPLWWMLQVVEAAAQTGAVALLADPVNHNRLPLFAGIDRAVFQSGLERGQTLLLETTLTRMTRSVGFGQGVVATSDGPVGSLKLIFAFAD